MQQGNKTRQRILQEANKLFYQQGFQATSIAHIVAATGLSKGNITYHFKSKQDILEGIIQNRIEDIDNLLRQWEQETDRPLERLMYFCNMLIHEQDNLASYGCPMGTLTAEFSKNQPQLYQMALPMFELFKQWLEKQFLLLEPGTQTAAEDAMLLLSRVQGIAVITHVFKDKDFLTHAVRHLQSEIRRKYSTAP